MTNYNSIFGLEEQEDKDLLSFYWFKSALTASECKDIIRIGKKFPKEKASTFNGSENEVRNSEVRWIRSNEETEFIFDKIRECCKEANKEQFKLDLTGFTEDLQFTEYEGVGKHYDWHADIGPEKNKRKLSVVIQLSDPKDYKGGNLILNTGNICITDRGIGNIIIFPSFLLHKVSKMESGNRYSIVSWVSGSPWK
jgi:PKHD-type hydroxylase